MGSSKGNDNTVSEYGGSKVIYIAYAATIATIVGTVANSLGKRWCFGVWMCTNAFWCVYNIVITQYAQAILYAFNFAMAIVGLVMWKRKKQKKRCSTNPYHFVALNNDPNWR